jgi:hypothetical protein
MDCGVITSKGTPCKRQAAPGFTRCNLHGAATPGAKQVAAQMLAQARVPGIEALHDIIAQFLEVRCQQCGYPTGDTETQRTVIAAAKVVLDRTEFGPHSTVTVTNDNAQNDLNLAQLTQDERAELAVLVAQLGDLKARVKARLALVLGDEAPPDDATIN